MRADLVESFVNSVNVAVLATTRNSIFPAVLASKNAISTTELAELFCEGWKNETSVHTLFIIFALLIILLGVIVDVRSVMPVVVAVDAVPSPAYIQVDPAKSAILFKPKFTITN